MNQKQTEQPNISTQPDEINSRFKKTKRIAAWVGIILLAALYLTTIISAIIATPATGTLFIMCIVGSVLIPLMIFGYIKLAKLLTGR